MAFAPLDAWWRILRLPGTSVPIWYWPRVAFNLYVSVFSTILTLPERLFYWPILTGKGRAQNWKLKVPAIVVLGYFRSGTTHLHYLLSCDKQNITPRWYQCLVPQGGPISWTFARLFMVPFMSEKRPMDDVAYGPEWPAEDDFANNLWTGTSVQVGRMIFTNEETFKYAQQFMTLTSLPPHAYNLWRRTLWKFLYKVTRFSSGKRLLLKSPSHTGHVNELLDFFDRDTKFIYINREPGATLKSNVSMIQRFETYQLEPPIDDAALQARMASDYRLNIEKYLEHRGSIPQGNLAEIRFEDLRDDPLGVLQNAYQQLGLEFTDQFKESLTVYLSRVKDYTPATKDSRETGESLPPELEFMIKEFRHDQPRIPKVQLPELPAGRLDNTRKNFRLALVLFIMPLIAGAIWARWSWWTQLRQEWIVWPAGVLIGWSILWAVRKGSDRLGIVGAAATLVVWLVVCFVNTITVSYAVNPHPDHPVSLTEELIPQTLKQLIKPRMLFWGSVGLITAFRFASRQRVHPLGDDRLRS